MSQPRSKDEIARDRKRLLAIVTKHHGEWVPVEASTMPKADIAALTLSGQIIREVRDEHEPGRPPHKRAYIRLADDAPDVTPSEDVVVFAGWDKNKEGLVTLVTRRADALDEPSVVVSRTLPDRASARALAKKMGLVYVANWGIARERVRLAREAHESASA